MPLTVPEYMETIRRSAQSGVTGDTIYDALLLACARQIQAQQIYTLNTRHFRRIAPDLADIIREP